MTTPENTSRRDPLLHLALSMSSSGRYIEEMEADGQRQLVHSDVLPAEGPWADHTGWRGPRDGVTLESLGFVKGDPVPGDEMFVHATLPPGWAREGSDHAMWSYITDERGVRRVSIFYKAAFYDRSAHASIERPGYAFTTEAIYGDGPAKLPEPWDVLTAEERADFRAGLTDYLDRAAEHPSIYGDRVAKVNTLLEMTER